MIGRGLRQASPSPNFSPLSSGVCFHFSEWLDDALGLTIKTSWGLELGFGLQGSGSGTGSGPGGARHIRARLGLGPGVRVLCSGAGLGRCDLPEKRVPKVTI